MTIHDKKERTRTGTAFRFKETSTFHRELIDYSFILQSESNLRLYTGVDKRRSFKVEHTHIDGMMEMTDGNYFDYDIYLN